MNGVESYVPPFALGETMTGRAARVPAPRQQAPGRRRLLMAISTAG
jgi:hypothetical protein